MGAQKNDKITVVGDDGSEIECQVLEVFELKGQDYVVVSTDDAVVPLQLHEADEGAIFRTIEDDAEYEFVRRFIEGLAALED